MKVLLTEKLSKCGIDALLAHKHQVVYAQVSGEELVKTVEKEQPQAIIVRSTKITSAVMDAAPSLELIVRAGAGYDNIDVENASRRCIYVSACPGKNSVAVAELVIGLMCALDRQIPSNVIDARAGKWEKAKYSAAEGLKGRVFGIIGLGNIAKAVVKRVQAMEMEVVAWSRSLTPELAKSMGIIRLDSGLEVAAKADVVSLHLAANQETKNFANKAFFEAMKPRAFFINTTRGSVVDEEALRWAMDNKGIKAGLDVFNGEPSAKSGEYQINIANHPSVYITHHIGASTNQAQDDTANEAARIVNTYGLTSVTENCINLQKKTSCYSLLTVRHLDKVGVLAGVLNEMRKSNYNVQEMDNIVFQGAEAACAHIRFNTEMYGASPSEGDFIRTIEGMDHVVSAYITTDYELKKAKKQRTE